LRTTAIARFRDEQRRTFRWIQLDDIAERCRVAADPTLSRAQRKEYYINALLSLLDSALAGDFVIEGRSRLLLAHYDYRIRRRWLDDPDVAPPKAFLTVPQLQEFIKGSTDSNIKSKVARYIIGNGWVPRALAVQWLETRRPPIAVPAAWQAADADGLLTPGTRVKRKRGGNKPKYDWASAEIVLFECLDERGDFDEPDQMDNWNRQRHAEEAVLDFFSKTDRQPSESSVRKFVNSIVKKWRSKAQN
jgi:hypothetical protein